MEEPGSHSTNSDKYDFDEDNWANDHWVVYCTATENLMKNQRNFNNQQKNLKNQQNNKLTSLNRIFYSNSSESLSFGREE